MTDRIDINTELNMESDHNFYTGLSEDITDGGIFVATSDPKPVGATVLVRFKLPGNYPVIARGVVQFVGNPNGQSEADQRSGMGVKFNGLMESDQRAIEEYLVKRNPERYTEPPGS